MQQRAPSYVPRSRQIGKSGDKGRHGFKSEKKNIKTGKKPEVGERKATRKRIVLSNDSALPVRSLDSITATSMIDGPGGETSELRSLLDDGLPEELRPLVRRGRRKDHDGGDEGGEDDAFRLPPPQVTGSPAAGKMLAIPGGLQFRLRFLNAFKSSQHWRLFHQPAVLVREETVTLLSQMRDTVARGATMRMILTGDRFVGKSVLLLQAMAYALANDWLVLNIPEGECSGAGLVRCSNRGHTG